MKTNFRFLTLGLVALSFLACEDSKDSVNPNPDNAFGNSTTQYIVCYNSGKDGHGYIKQVDDITSGLINGTTKTNNRFQVTGNRDYIQVGTDYIYNINYSGQGSDGTSSLSTSWELDENNNLKQRKDLNLAGDVKSRGVWGKYIIGAASQSESSESGITTKSSERIKLVNTEADEVITNDGSINTLYGEISSDIPDENVTFRDIAGYGDYVLIGMSTRNNDRNIRTSEYYDNTYIGVYEYEAGDAENEFLKLKRLIKRESTPDKMAGQLMPNSRSRNETGIEPVENGDIYVFCHGRTKSATAVTYPPGAVLKINNTNGAMPEAFDADYYVDLQKLADGHRVWRTFYMGGTKFCLQMHTTSGDANISNDTKYKFGIFDAAAKTFDWVTGVPTDISDVRLFVLAETDLKRVTFAISTTSKFPALYSITEDGVMSRGLEIQAEGIDGIGILKR